MKQVAFAVLAWASIIGVATAEETGPSADIAAVKAFGADWARYYGAGDIDSMARLYEPDAVLMTHGQPMLRGKEAILAYFRARAGRAALGASFDYESVVVEGRRATLISKYWLCLRVRDTGQQIRAQGRSLLTFKKGRDRVWRLWRDMDNTAPDVNADDPRAPAC
jgi:uncharacterized protein (TIGR02246 family)